MFNENEVENTIIILLKNEKYEFLDNENDYWLNNRQLDEFINKKVLFDCLRRINKIDDESILEMAINHILTLDNPSLFERNYDFHKLLIDGLSLETVDDINPTIYFIDFNNPENNVFQVVHQVKFNEGKNTRIPDVIIYVNGIPLVVMELKSFAEDAINATLERAYEQLGSNSENDGYRYDIPTLFNFNSFLVISDGVNTKVGTLTSKIDRYNEWKSIEGEKGYDTNCVHKLDVLIKGVFNKTRFLDIIKNNIFFILDKNDKPIKIMGQYHQYFGVLKSVNSVKNAIKPVGDGKAGIIWHTQGSGKSYSMVMLAHRIICEQSLKVPTIVVLTDRIDLDDQLDKTFYSARDYLKCEPQRAISREDLVNKLNDLRQGGIILTTIGKFDKNNLPKNERTNIIVMTDEAHRSHYGIYETVKYEKNKNTDEYKAIFKYGVEKYIREALPNATFIGYTGTPVSSKDKQTTDVFGEIIDTYDMTQSIIDGSTVKLYYESRLAKVWIDDNDLKEIDAYYKDLEENEKSDSESIEKSKKEMSKLKVILEDDDMIELFAKNIMEHYEERKGFLNGKAMIICQTRVAALKLYKKITEDLYPEMKNQVILVVTESNKDTEQERRIFGDSDYRRTLGEEFKKDNSKYKIAIVVDMWLTGFDVPDLDVMYFIKRLKAHNLMQAIARVNRIYPGKEGGLIVDYIGLSKALDEAFTFYTDRDRKEKVQDIRKEIYNLFKEKLSFLNECFFKVDKSKFYSNDSAKRFAAIQLGSQFVLETKEREIQFMEDLSISIKQAFVLCGGITTEEEKNDVYYYLAIRSFILKLRTSYFNISIKDMNVYVSKLLADAIKGDEVKVLTENKNESINVIELLSPKKIAELRQKNPPLVFMEIIKQLLERAIFESRKNNYFKSQEYSKRLRKILEKYSNRDGEFLPEATIAVLVSFANEMVSDEEEANRVGVFGRERAFYDALIRDRSAHDLLNDETLKLIAHELKEIIEEYATTDWSHKQATRAKMRTKIKECLKKYNYPPEYTKEAVQDVIKQAEYIMEEKR
ncbi:type I restriction endonuclease subunit R [Ureaplasma sp. ES3154-GEN]|uniref:type I restriction endonuclease subunit R n=1 Tax=Ureaplasma sp. ES3154-GEN TaxID=2984844 RepID=UPI0021E8EAA8|nr:type I restriction endonuclease subunit R [Ureaplasma sp. ES3154-GEN]MCV3743504.1 type I restriction endonuclease subunit R [Ureaplasma sp. ES3154-GEN]